MSTKQKKHLWFEKLTFWMVIKIFVFFNNSKHIVFYCSGKGKILFLIKLLRSVNLFLPEIRRVKLRIGVHDKKGKTLRYQIEANTRKIVASIFKSRGNIVDKLPAIYRVWTDQWQRILKSSYSDLIKRKIIFLSEIDNHYELDLIEKNNVNEIIVFVDWFAGKYCLLKLYNKMCSIPVKIKFIENARFNLIFFPFPGMIFYIFCKACLAKLQRLPSQSIDPNALNKGIIFEEYIVSVFDRYPEAGHLFWFAKSGISTNRVVLYCDRKDSPCNKKMIDEVNSYGFGYIDFSRQFCLVNNSFAIFIKSVINSRSFFPKKWNALNCWLWLSFVYNVFNLEINREIFQRYNVKAIHQHQEWNAATIVKALAIRMENGIFIWNHWSVDHHLVEYFDYGLADLLLSWGKYNDGYFNAHSFLYTHMVQTGMIAGDGCTGSKKNNYLKTEFSQQVKFIVIIFDTSHGNNCPDSTITMIKFYEKLLSLILKHKSWGAILKPKGNNLRNLSYIDSVHGVINRLNGEGRCIHTMAKIRCSEAALAGDVSVCLGINSAGILAACTDKPVLHWDISGNQEHPLYYLGGENKLIFKTIEGISDALEKIEKGNSILGNHNDVIQFFDEFRDNKGYERAGELIGNYLRLRDKGVNSDCALADACKIYSDKYGEEKVTKYGDLQKHIGNSLWQKVLEQSGY